MAKATILIINFVHRAKARCKILNNANCSRFSITNSFCPVLQVGDKLNSAYLALAIKNKSYAFLKIWIHTVHRQFQRTINHSEKKIDEVVYELGACPVCTTGG
jgi:hypothetical protein